MRDVSAQVLDSSRGLGMVRGEGVVRATIRRMNSTLESRERRLADRVGEVIESDSTAFSGTVLSSA